MSSYRQKRYSSTKLLSSTANHNPPEDMVCHSSRDQTSYINHLCRTSIPTKLDKACHHEINSTKSRYTRSICLPAISKRYQEVCDDRPKKGRKPYSFTISCRRGLDTKFVKIASVVNLIILSLFLSSLANCQTASRSVDSQGKFAIYSFSYLQPRSVSRIYTSFTILRALR